MVSNVVYMYDLDFLEDFKDEFIDAMSNMENRIIALQNSDDYSENINSLFRTFHSLKAHSVYLGADEMTKVFKSVEGILHILRNRKPPVSVIIVDWLLLILDVMKGWEESVEKTNFDVSPIDIYILNMVKIASMSSVSTNSIMKTLSVLVIANDDTKISKLSTMIRSSFKKVYGALTNDALNSAEQNNPDIVLIVSDLQDSNIVDLIKDIKAVLDHKPFYMVASKRPNVKIYNMVRKLDIDSIYPITDTEDILINRLRTITESNYGDKWISIEPKDIKTIVNTLAPLPDTIIELQKKSIDPQSTPRDIAGIISKDPVLMAKMLKVVNSPIFGLRSEITNIQNAVAMLGKERISALAMQEAVSDAFKIPNLSVYGIDSDKFFKIARKRMELMTAWYSKVAFSKLAILATSSLLGSLGQILLAPKISKEGKTKEFTQLLLNTNSTTAESEILNITAEEVTANILAHWGMNQLLIDSIRYCYNMLEAPDEAKSYVIANYVVYNTIASASNDDEEELLEVIDEMCEFLSEMNLESKAFRKACSKVLGI